MAFYNLGSSVIITGFIPYNPITYMICVMVKPQLTTDEDRHERCCHDDFSRRLSRDVRTPAGFHVGSFLAQVDGPSLAESSSSAQILISQQKHDVMLSCA
ncbi:hypothetical protein QBC45DRAFT_453805 [Copromyces sp. CBS 386.78]|nr:hypothetical protein QBC45DRAFT_453805 [Copromyces sp. CBS 386.78]